MDPTPAADFLRAAEKVVALPSGRNVTIRKLGMDELLDVPEAWPIFNVMLGAIDDGNTSVSPQERLRSAMTNAEVQAAIIRRGVVTPKVSNGVEEPDAVPLYVFDHVDRIVIVNEITLLSTGFQQFVEMEAAASRAAGFPEAPDAAAGDEGS